ncbi:ribosomal protein S18-alanine N-acetyltransferase [Candidatus Palauibacter sp.]|uniref:ribosomal protein S18-alanine N-acetyltransferase n=1 Tax=Candidatus Palauibacter sp. TaxID=3101350 RepID=UPI003B59287B
MDAGKPPPRIRRLAAADLPQVVAIEEASFAAPWSAQTFRNLLRRRDACLFSAVAEGERVVGYAAVWFAGPQGELGDLAVDPVERRGGIGARLVEAVLAEARSRGARQIFLEVREGNRGAQGLYRGCGFEVVGRHPAYYAGPTEDALTMRRLLAR